MMIFQHLMKATDFGVNNLFVVIFEKDFMLLKVFVVKGVQNIYFIYDPVSVTKNLRPL